MKPLARSAKCPQWKRQTRNDGWISLVGFDDAKKTVVCAHTLHLKQCQICASKKLWTAKKAVIIGWVPNHHRSNPLFLSLHSKLTWHHHTLNHCQPAPFLMRRIIKFSRLQHTSICGGSGSSDWHFVNHWAFCGNYLMHSNRSKLKKSERDS